MQLKRVLSTNHVPCPLLYVSDTNLVQMIDSFNYSGSHSFKTCGRFWKYKMKKNGPW